MGKGEARGSSPIQRPIRSKHGILLALADTTSSHLRLALLRNYLDQTDQ